MGGRSEREPDEKGLSARHLVLVFLAGVAVCGVFFSLGFLVGYNERSSRITPVTERVTVPPVVPPTVNAPAEAPTSAGKEPATGTSGANSLGESRLPTPAAAGSEWKPPATPPAPVPAATKIEKRADPASVGSPAAGGGEVDVGFTVQIAASRTKQDAEALVRILKTRGYPVLLVAPEYAHANDNLFRVQVGPYTSRDDAEKVRDRLAREGFKPFIRH